MKVPGVKSYKLLLNLMTTLQMIVSQQASARPVLSCSMSPFSSKKNIIITQVCDLTPVYLVLLFGARSGHHKTFRNTRGVVQSINHVRLQRKKKKKFYNLCCWSRLLRNYRMCFWCVTVERQQSPSLKLQFRLAIGHIFSWGHDPQFFYQTFKDNIKSHSSRHKMSEKNVKT